MLAAVIAALASAATFAAGSALQHRAASAGSPDDEPGHQMITRLLKRRSWLLGLLLSAVAFGLHGLALSQGELALVQPVIVSGIVFAVLIRAALERQLPSRRVLLWLVATWAGLAIVIAVRSSRSTAATGVHHEVLFVVLGALAAGLVGFAASRTTSDRRRGALLGVAAGTLFGLVAGLLKLVTVEAKSGLGQAVSHWSLWALLVIGGVAVLLNQLAYQSARLSVTAPLLNIAQVLVALAFGAVVFGERFDGSTLAVAAEVGGLLLLGAGIWQLAAQPADDKEPSDSATH